MAYNRDKVHADILKVIEDEKITFFNDLEAFIEPTMATLYEWEFEKSETIKRAITINRIQSKKKMRRNWEASDNATLQIAAYKLIAEPEEIDRITVNKFEHTGKDKGPIQTEIQVTVIDGTTTN